MRPRPVHRWRREDGRPVRLGTPAALRRSLSERASALPPSRRPARDARPWSRLPGSADTRPRLEWSPRPREGSGPRPPMRRPPPRSLAVSTEATPRRAPRHRCRTSTPRRPGQSSPPAPTTLHRQPPWPPKLTPIGRPEPRTGPPVTPPAPPHPYSVRSPGIERSSRRRRPSARPPPAHGPAAGGPRHPPAHPASRLPRGPQPPRASSSSPHPHEPEEGSPKDRCGRPLGSSTAAGDSRASSGQRPARPWPSPGQDRPRWYRGYRPASVQARCSAPAVQGRSSRPAGRKSRPRGGRGEEVNRRISPCCQPHRFVPS